MTKEMILNTYQTAYSEKQGSFYSSPQEIHADVSDIKEAASSVSGKSLLSSVPVLVAVGVFLGLVVATVIIVPVVISLKSATTTTTSTTSTTTTSTTTLYYSCSNFTLVFNWDYGGNDINSISPTTFPYCCSWCLATSTCTTFVFLNSSLTCWIKTSMGSGGSSYTSMIAAHQ